MQQARYISAREAAAELGVSVATIYAYVSRGLLRSEAVAGDTRQRRYRLDDVRRLKARQEGRRDPSTIAEGALHWGAPVLESSLTLITDERLYYRGYDVVQLAAKHTAEEVAAMVWTGTLSSEVVRLIEARSPVLTPRLRKVRRQLGHLTPIELFAVLLPLAAADDLAAYDVRPAAVIQAGARIVRLLTTILTGTEQNKTSIAQTLQRAWTPAVPQAVQLIDAALILCADHELNVSSFTARCVASAGSTPYAVVAAGLAALQGVKHGGHTARVEALLREVATADEARPALARMLKRGEAIPGFGHVLYPNGDPRAEALLQMVMDTLPTSPTVVLAKALIAEAQALLGERPTIDFGLVTLAQALGLPSGGALGLFALGRTIGWIGHALEQYALDTMIRPRARYVGEPPGRRA